MTFLRGVGVDLIPVRPDATLSGAVRVAADRLGMSTVELSRSHFGGFAIAQAVLVFEGGPCVST